MGLRDKVICPHAGTCTNDPLCKHNRPHIANSYCNATTHVCRSKCCEATPELKAKIEAEKIVRSF
jgi:hypothetical protein